MLAMGLPLRPINTPLAGAPGFGWGSAGWLVHKKVTTSAMTRSEVGLIMPPALCGCDGHPLHFRALWRAIISRPRGGCARRGTTARDRTASGPFHTALRAYVDQEFPKDAVSR